MRVGLILCGVIAMSPRFVLAHEKEPINTEYAPPVEALVFHVTGSGFERQGGTLFTLPGFALEAPILPAMQFEAGIPILRFAPDEGDGHTNFGDLEIGLRRQLVPESGEGAIPDLDVNVELGIPTGDRSAGLGGEAWEAAIGLFLTKHSGKSVWFGNFSYVAEIPRESDTERENLFDFAVAAVHSVSDRLHPTLELFGEWNVTDDETQAFVAPELLFTLNGGWELKAGVPIGITDATADVGFQIRLTYLRRPARHASGRDRRQ